MARLGIQGTRQGQQEVIDHLIDAHRIAPWAIGQPWTRHRMEHELERAHSEHDNEEVD